MDNKIVIGDVLRGKFTGVIVVVRYISIDRKTFDCTVLEEGNSGRIKGETVNDLELYNFEKESNYINKIKDVPVKSSDNNGGATNYYDLPVGAKNIQDLIEHKNMNFSQGNIIKAIYRTGSCEHSEYERDLNKIIWFANRELERIKKGR